MSKRIAAKVGTYTKDGQEKGKYVRIGVILNNDNGEYVLLDPSVSLAGIAYQQRVNGIAKQNSDSVIASVFLDEQQSQRPQEGRPNLPPQQGVQQARTSYGPQDLEPTKFDDIPF